MRFLDCSIVHTAPVLSSHRHLHREDPLILIFLSGPSVLSFPLLIGTSPSPHPPPSSPLTQAARLWLFSLLSPQILLSRLRSLAGPAEPRARSFCYQFAVSLIAAFFLSVATEPARYTSHCSRDQRRENYSRPPEPGPTTLRSQAALADAGMEMLLRHLVAVV